MLVRQSLAALGFTGSLTLDVGHTLWMTRRVGDRVWSAGRNTDEGEPRELQVIDQGLEDGDVCGGRTVRPNRGPRDRIRSGHRSAC